MSGVLRNRVQLAIHGASGRMGRRLIALAAEDPVLVVAGALERAGHPDLGRDAGELSGLGPIGVPLTDCLSSNVEVLIDFSVPEAVVGVLNLCMSRRIPLVLATTGIPAAQHEQIRAAAATIPLVWAPNMSLAVNLVMKLADVAAEALQDYGPGVDVEIVERHHRFKEDAPSGTALRFGEIIAARLGQTRHQHGRVGRPGARARDEIGYHALRTGDNPGEHTLVFGLLGETIELSVSATNRDCYALGALAAAKFLVGRPPGCYGMRDVLGL